jgi:hypothetical protein
MAEDKQAGRARTQDDVGCVFINHVLGSGHLNGIINVTLGTFNFTPSRDAARIEPDLVVSCRLRLDVVAAAELRDAIDKALTMMATQAAAQVEQSQHDAAALN